MHCKDVSVREVDFPLTKGNIDTAMRTWTSYVRTEGLVLKNGDAYSTVLLSRSSGKGLFRSVSGHRIVSLPEDTVYVEDPDLDVINIPALAELQCRYPGRTIVVKGMFSHVNFVNDLEPLELVVVENVPPEPSKLRTLVDRALASGFVDIPVVATDMVIDMEERLPDVRTEAVMFPCRVSGLTAGIPVYFLDEAPELKHEVTLIGCHLSMRIFTELYGRTPPFINVCPADLVDGRTSIVKCCKVKEGSAIDGNVAKVPWGATVPEVVDAINSLFQRPASLGDGGVSLPDASRSAQHLP